ncbi:MAG: hypothetical protein ACK5V3_10710 [Bdellovibrionales bacterium]
MVYKQVLNSLFYLLTATVCSLLIFWTTNHGQTLKVKDFISPPKGIEHFAVGMRPQLADLIWIRSIQDIDYCEKSEHAKKCKDNDWLYRMLKAVVTLDPKYYSAYASGGLALSVLVSDYEGATEIYNLGIKEYPNDWVLLYRAGYHFLFEVNDFERASELYSRVSDLGGPFWVVTLGKRLNTKEGKLEVGRKVLDHMIKAEMPPQFAERLREKLKAIEASED